MDEAVQYSENPVTGLPPRYVAAGAGTADFLSGYYAAKLICSAAALRHSHDFLKPEIIYCGSHRFCASSCTLPLSAILPPVRALRCAESRPGRSCFFRSGTLPPSSFGPRRQADGALSSSSPGASGAIPAFHHDFILIS